MIRMNRVRYRVWYLTAMLVVFIIATPVQGQAMRCDTVMTNPDSAQDSSQTFTVNGVSFKMIHVEGGTFMMGATAEQEDDAYDDEKPVHSVTLSSYYIGETVVTQALWEAVMGTTVVQHREMNHIGQRLRGVGPTLPMYFVSWHDCQTFISKLNTLTGQHFRLPTEAEWEYAARGGNKSRGYKYSGGDDYDRVCWCDENSRNTAHPVKTKLPNELGIYDMSGGVWEWCEDYSQPYNASPKTNPKEERYSDYRRKRGGSWRYVLWHCRISYRSSSKPDERASVTGFRLVL